IAEGVRCCANVGSAAAGWIVACIAGGAVGSGGAGGAGDQLARRELREQLRADLLKALIVSHAGGRQYSGVAAIDLYAYFNSDIRPCGPNTPFYLPVLKKARYPPRPH